jgi:glycosyltransferase involved in cell wall biosynthesis/MoaA/NifB/PqqE/SkfB family radical SAM enzyme
MKVLQVIHGYPPRYNAGSEVYTQTLCHGLAGRHQVQVFTREEDSFAPDFALRRELDRDDDRITLHVVNVPRSKDRYRHVGVDRRFAEVLDAFEPDVVHIGHLNHLSTSLVGETASRRIPVVYTLHDYWLMCPRGQFMQMHPEDPLELWAACEGQDDRKCAERCYERYFSGSPEEREVDLAYWDGWVSRRMTHVREMVEVVDLFVAPARYLEGRYRDRFDLPAQKVVFLDYGFDLNRLQGRRRRPDEPFTFGYIGTHIPAKGIHHLLEAFGTLRGAARLRIWGRPRGQDTEALKELARHLPGDASTRVEWLPEYRNINIVTDVFDEVDAIVVPSIWVENSPLVIHEAQGAGLPVITADAGGMAEYVAHEVNGLLFRHRDSVAMAAQMQRFVDDPELAARLGRRGYLFSEDGAVPGVHDHVAAVEDLYRRVIAWRDAARLDQLPGPWRITFDTNPDTCNRRCVMCEEHSPYSALQEERRNAGKARRIMPIELVRQVIEEAALHGMREVIPSTMGEPLLYEHFDEIIEICRELGVQLNLTTNGSFPRRSARAWAELLVPVTSDVKLSLNGATKATQERIMGGSCWEQGLDDLRSFIAVRDTHAEAGGNRCRVTLQVTFMELNVSEMADIVRLAVELGADRVKGHHLWVHFDRTEPLSMRRSPEAIRRWNEAVAKAREAAEERTLPSGRAIVLENFHLLDERKGVEELAPSGPCPFLGREAWISAEGRFDPCCAPDALRRSLGELGNLHDRGIMEIWRSEPYRRLVATYRTRALCLDCLMRRPAEAS